jgi:hypothetical protein
MKTPFVSCFVCLLTVFVSAPVALAGPPLLCHPIPIAEDQSLPWGKDAFTKSASYDSRRLVSDTLTALDSATSVLVRMETLRRATLYINRNTQIADDLMGSLMSRVQDAEATGQHDAMAWFDAGYLAACFSQSATNATFGPAAGKGSKARSIPGYSWVVKAIEISGGNTSMELAAALITVDHRVPEHRSHVKNVLAVSDLDAASKDLLQWIAQINGTTIESLRSQLGVADASSGR